MDKVNELINKTGGVERLECESNELHSNLIVLASNRRVTWGRSYQMSGDSTYNVRRFSHMVTGLPAGH